MYHLFTSHVCGLRLALSMNLFTYIKTFFGVLFFEKQFYSYIFSNTFDIKNSMKRYSIPFLENMFLRTVLKNNSNKAHTCSSVLLSDNRILRDTLGKRSEPSESSDEEEFDVSVFSFSQHKLLFLSELGLSD